MLGTAGAALSAMAAAEAATMTVRRSANGALVRHNTASTSGAVKNRPLMKSPPTHMTYARWRTSPTPAARNRGELIDNVTAVAATIVTIVSGSCVAESAR